MGVETDDNEPRPIDIGYAQPDERKPLLSGPAVKRTIVQRVRAALASQTSQIGYLFMFLSAFSQATRAFLFHTAETQYAMSPSIALIISSIMFASLCLVTLAAFNLWHTLRLPRVQMMRLALRGFFTATTVYLINVSLAFIPVGTSLTLLATTPSMTSLLAALFLRDAITMPDVVVLLLNMGGVVLVAQPSPVSSPHQLVGIIAGLAAALSASFGFTLVKVMGLRVHFVLNTLAIGMGGLFLALFVTSMDDVRDAMLPDRSVALFLALVGGVLGFLSQCFINRGMQLCRPGPALVVRSFNVPVSFLLGLVFLSESLSMVALCGVALILASVGITAFVQIAEERAALALQLHVPQPLSLDTSSRPAS